MSTAISNSLAGLRSATQSLNVAANKIVRSGAAAANELASVTDETTPTQNSGAPIQPNFSSDTDLVSGIVELKLAEFSYKASAKVFQVASRLEQSLLDTLR